MTDTVAPKDLPTKSLIILIGMMGAGKTTIGRALAKKIGRKFVDLDHAIVERCGVDIPTIFDIEGEEGFRKRESEVLQDVLLEDEIVLATGGGAVLAEANRQLMQCYGEVFYLRVDVDELYRRVAKDKNRPLLATPDPKARLAELLAARADIYESMADHIIDSAADSLNTVVDQMINLLAERDSK
ncbi:shikimate kinase [Oligella sp. HMSC05A10]|uniref:shikimate kinase n=1 Tax=Oligella sp. HMSC05A10 TaxID=1581112 RepID=UPI0008A298F9|nr:shikimate kinase [Oligella sp. HMSC05A10]OFS85632.1 shikimate kinase [Oligella sp. HMSC05A10]